MALYINHPYARPYLGYGQYVEQYLQVIKTADLERLIQIKNEVNNELNRAENVIINDNIIDATIISKINTFNINRNICITNLSKHFNTYINLYIIKKH